MAPPVPQPPERSPVPCGWAVFVVASSPAAFLTISFDAAVSRQPHGWGFHLTVLLGPAAFGLAAYFALILIARIESYRAVNVSVNVCFAASLVAFALALLFFIR
jgi:hypothetical protein